MDNNNRIKNAITILKAGGTYKVGQLFLGMIDKNKLYVTGNTGYSDLNLLTKSKALQEINNIKLDFTDMLNCSHELREFLEGKNVEFNLAYFYGMGGVGICSEQNNKITWLMDLKS